ncbi:MAG: hypothetical protein KC427_07665 [Sulfurovum sp.]|uniref:hypothetical protein n=1 Tax=Sulfurovum sp. TaxID=1969726 RepID=UPI002867CF97|nr:hypothetical protein [Sulfurovum sp.]MCO4845877.1 hypothetical protein [Sulfurovum sp.]
MYYILNETNQIIAADDNLLELCGVSHIDDLSLKIALGDTKFDLSEEHIIITTNTGDKTFSMSKTSLSSMLGHITLVEIQAEEDDLSVFTVDDEIESIAPMGAEEISEEIEIAIDDNELFDLAVEDETESKIDTVEDSLHVITEDTDILDLGLSDKASEVTFDKPVSDDTAEILVDIDKVCQQIGVSHEDYDTFLNEYIDTALGLEEDLQSTDSTKRLNAVETLSHLGEVLQLPVIGDIIARVDTVPANEQKETVESFYAALSRITTSPTSQAEPEMELFDTQEEDKVDLFDVEEEKEPAQEVTVNEKSFGTISLEGIKPIHFDFQLEEAAKDLSLPVELIEEFVHDFIEQGHIETEKMLKAYEEGDLDAIQKIGHLLKGTSSNLRINALSDTLYKIQFCENSSDLEHFIKDYWGHFLSFEIQINALAK